jgi:hypothetical protein
MARYRILVPDGFLEIGLEWPEGCSLVERLEAGSAGTHWWLFDDPGAEDGLEGREVTLKVGRGEDGKPVITERREALVHLMPQDDSCELGCCGLAAWEMPRADRAANDKDLVTCGGGAG